jgi:hypothetical protein
VWVATAILSVTQWLGYLVGADWLVYTSTAALMAIFAVLLNRVNCVFCHYFNLYIICHHGTLDQKSAKYVLCGFGATLAASWLVYWNVSGLPHVICGLSHALEWGRDSMEPHDVVPGKTEISVPQAVSHKRRCFPRHRDRSRKLKGDLNKSLDNQFQVPFKRSSLSVNIVVCDIAGHLANEIKANNVDSVVISSPYFTGGIPTVLNDALAKLSGTITVVAHAPSNENFASCSHFKMFKSWARGATDYSSDRWEIYNLSRGRGRFSSIAHCKHVIGLDADGVPVFATTGSYNLTGGSPTNIEDLCIYHDREVCKHYLAKVENIIDLADYHGGGGLHGSHP